MRRWISIAGAVVVVAAIAVGIAQSGQDKSGQTVSVITPDQAGSQLRGAQPRLAQIHAQSGKLLRGGIDGYRDRVRELRGLPVVVNAWAAWCVPCRNEMPVFNRVSVKLGKRVAFLGINPSDNRDDAEELLAEIPVSYPSYEDGDGAIANSFPIIGMPSTIFYDRSGREFVHQGPYLSEQDLIADIERYALSG